MSEKLLYTGPARTWEEALPIGNGSLGGMVFGNQNCDRVALNLDTLWSGHPVSETKPGAAEAFRKAQALALEGKYGEAEDLLQNDFLSCWSEVYMPMGNLEVGALVGYDRDLPYLRTLDLSTGLAETEYTRQGCREQQTVFCSHPDGVLVYRVKAEEPGTLSGRYFLETPLRYTLSDDGKNTLIIDGECPWHSATHGLTSPCARVLTYEKDPAHHGIRFRMAGRFLHKGGRFTLADGQIDFTGCSEILILLAAESSFIDGYTMPEKPCEEQPVSRLDAAERLGYEALKARHIEDHQSLYNRVSLRIGDGHPDEVPTDIRLKRHHEGERDDGLYELLFQYGRYLTIAGSRAGTQPLNLQGIWNPHLNPPWMSNYTTNINTEMNYWPTLAANLAECLSPLCEKVKALPVNGRDTAENFYGAPGWVCHHNTDLWNFTAPIQRDCQWGFWQGGSGWLLQNLWEYWLYTEDRDWLKEYYPVFREAAVFYDSLLTEEDGKLFFCPATSPENQFRKDGRAISCCKWTACQQAIIAGVFLETAEAADVLGIPDDFTRSLREKAGKMPIFEIGSKGQILEWNEEFEETEPDNAHKSHLIGFHPMRMIPRKDTELLQAVRRSLELRGDNGTGWSLGWKINMRARLCEGDHALKMMDMQLNPVGADAVNNGTGGTYSNLMDAHPPFQIDGNFGFTAGLCEMLVQWEPGCLYLLPALPSDWQEGEISGLKAPGNLTVHMKWKDGRLTGWKIDGDTEGLRIFEGDRELSH